MDNISPIGNYEALINWVERSGVPFGILCVLSYIFLKCFYWFMEKVVVPLVTNHTNFLQEVRMAIGDIAKTNCMISEKMTDLIDIQKENSAAINDLSQGHEEYIVDNTLIKKSKTATIPKVESSQYEHESVSAH